jgi:hypothetical protein
MIHRIRIGIALLAILVISASVLAQELSEPKGLTEPIPQLESPAFSPIHLRMKRRDLLRFKSVIHPTFLRSVTPGEAAYGHVS